MSDIDNLLDATLDDIADLPEFKPYPAGVHRVLVTFETKEVNKEFCIEVNCKLIETIELPELGEEAPEPGATANVLCMMSNEFSAGKFKKMAKPIGEALGTRSLREIVEQTKDLECIILTSIRVDKEDKDKKYMNIQDLQVV
jgi:hypothetical protein